MSPLQAGVLGLLIGGLVYYFLLRPREYPRVLLVDPANPGQVLAELKGGRHMLGSLRTHGGRELTGFVLAFSSASFGDRFREFARAPSGKPWRRAYLVLDDPRHLFEHRGAWGREYVVFGRFEPRMLDSGAREIALVHIPPEVVYHGSVLRFDLSDVLEEWRREAKIAELYAKYEQALNRVRSLVRQVERLSRLAIAASKAEAIEATQRAELMEALKAIRETKSWLGLRTPEEIRRVERLSEEVERLRRSVEEVVARERVRGEGAHLEEVS